MQMKVNLSSNGGNKTAHWQYKRGYTNETNCSVNLNAILNCKNVSSHIGAASLHASWIIALSLIGSLLQYLLLVDGAFGVDTLTPLR